MKRERIGLTPAIHESYIRPRRRARNKRRSSPIKWLWLHLFAFNRERKVR